MFIISTLLGIFPQELLVLTIVSLLIVFSNKCLCKIHDAVMSSVIQFRGVVMTSFIIIDLPSQSGLNNTS